MFGPRMFKRAHIGRYHFFTRLDTRRTIKTYVLPFPVSLCVSFVLQRGNFRFISRGPIPEFQGNRCNQSRLADCRN